MIGHAQTDPLLAGAPLAQPASAVLSTGRLDFVDANGGYCGPVYQTGKFGVALSSSQGLSEHFPGAGADWGFCHTFKFVNKAGAVTVGEICWRRGVLAGSLNLINLPPNFATAPTLGVARVRVLAE